MSKPETLQMKLERLETLVDALLEERKGLREDLAKFESRLKKFAEENDLSRGSEEFVRTLDDLRRRLSETEASNQKFVRDRNLVKERLGQVLNRLDLIEAKLLEQRSLTAT